MAETVYQQLRAHVHELRLSAVAEQLAPALEYAERDKPSYTQSLHDLLAHDVTAVEHRRLQGRLRFANSPRVARSINSTSPPNRAWTGAWSKTSPRCGLSKTKRTCC